MASASCPWCHAQHFALKDCLKTPAADTVLRPARSCAVCITCQHFRYEVGRHCVTVLTYPIHQGLIPQGEHLNKRCAQWVARREVAVGWCPEAG